MIELQASALNRVMACNGSVAMGGAVEVPPDKDQSESRREGIAAHFVAMTVISGQFKDPVEWVDRQAPNGVFITPDMADHIETFTESVLSTHRDDTLWLETPMDYEISASVKILNRPDVIGWDPTTGTATVHDFKYGFRLVEPFDNWTLVSYLVAWVYATKIIPATVRFVIHQPRPWHENGKRREVVMSYDDLLKKYAHMVSKLEALDNMLHTGPQCYKCPAMANCPAHREAGYNAIEASMEAFSDDAPDEELLNQYELLKRATEHAKQRFEAVEELLEHRINNGAVIRNMFFEPQYGHTKFTLSAPEAIRQVKLLTGIDISKPGVLTPSQAIKAGVPETIIKVISDRPKIGQKLKHKKANEVASRMFTPPTT